MKIVKIVHLDDDPINRDLFKIMMARIDKATPDATISFESYATGQQFIEEYESRKYEGIDIFFTDWAMPEMDGGEVIAQVRSINKRLNIWIVSALLSEKDIPKCCLTHNCMTLPKPVTLREVSIVIKQLMAERDLSTIWDDKELSK